MEDIRGGRIMDERVEGKGWKKVEKEKGREARPGSRRLFIG